MNRKTEFGKALKGNSDFALNLNRPGNRREVSFDFQWPPPKPTASNVTHGGVTLLDVNQHSSTESILDHAPDDHVIDLSGPLPSKGDQENPIDLRRPSPPPATPVPDGAFKFTLKRPAVEKQFNPKDPGGAFNFSLKRPAVAEPKHPDGDLPSKSVPDGDFNLSLKRSAVAATDGTLNFKLKRPVGDGVPTADGPSNFNLEHPVGGPPDGVLTPDSMFNFTLKRPVRDTPDDAFNFTLKRPIMAPNKAADEAAKEGTLRSIPSNAAAVPEKHSGKPFNFNLRRPAAAPLPTTEAPPGTASEPMGLNSPQGQASNPAAKAYVPSAHPWVSDYKGGEWLDEMLSFPRYADSTKKEELDDVIAEVQNLSSRARDSAQALEFLRREKIELLYDVETFLEVMGEIRDEVYAGTRDFMLSLQEKS